MSRMYRFTLGIGFLSNAGRSQDIDVADELGMEDEDWDGLPEEEKESALEELWQEWSSDYIEGGYEPID